MIIDPTEDFVILELEKMKWFLGKIDLTKNATVGMEIQNAFTSVSEALKLIRKL